MDSSDDIDPDKKAGRGPVVIEATWAPKDPRDRLYDADATKGERTMSLIRIVAAFHPVLNSFLLTSDMIRRIPARWLFAFLIAVCFALVAIFFDW